MSNITIRAAIERIEIEANELGRANERDNATIMECRDNVIRRGRHIIVRRALAVSLKDMLAQYGDQEVPLLFEQEVKST